MFEGDKENLKEILEAESHLINKCETMGKTIKLMESVLRSVNE